MCEKSHQLDETDSSHETCYHANHSLEKDELPAPIFVNEREEGESEVAEHESFQSETNNLKSG
jgi:hypothetical protein